MFDQKYGRVETQLKNICFFVTVATIPALKMTHLSLAGLPGCHIFCQFVFAVVTKKIDSS